MVSTYLYFSHLRAGFAVDVINIQPFIPAFFPWFARKYRSEFSSEALRYFRLLLLRYRHTLGKVESVETKNVILPT